MEQNETSFDPTIDEVDETEEKTEINRDFFGGDKTPKIPRSEKAPRIRKAELRNMVMRMSGLGKAVVDCVLDTYLQVVERMLLNGVEVPVGDLGILGFADIKPIPRKVRWNAALKDYVECLPRAGHKRVKFREGNRFRGRMYWATAKGEIPTMYEYVEWVNKNYGDKSRFKNVSKEELDAQEADRQWKIRTRGGLDRDPLEDKTDEQN